LTVAGAIVCNCSTGTRGRVRNDRGRREAFAPSRGRVRGHDALRTVRVAGTQGIEPVSAPLPALRIELDAPRASLAAAPLPVSLIEMNLLHRRRRQADIRSLVEPDAK
jgi:hypothetical protein